MERRLIAIVGPTASGKTEVAFKLAKRLDTEIISADSRQIYRELNIGTAKPPQNYLDEIKHHFINHVSIIEKYDVGKYVTEARKIIEQLHSKNKIPIVVGGTGLYINSLLFGLFEGPSADEKVRQRLEKELDEKGIDYILNQLREVDFVTFEKIDKNNSRRIIRALEVYYLTGIPISELHKQTIKTDYENFIFGLNWERKVLYDRINKRVDCMIETGFLDEVKDLMKIFGIENPVIRDTVGYKEIIDFYEGKLSFNEMVELIKRNTRRYAKRQLTWFRKLKGIFWFDVNSNSYLDLVVQKIINVIKEGNKNEN